MYGSITTRGTDGGRNPGVRYSDVGAASALTKHRAERVIRSDLDAITVRDGRAS